MNQLQVLVNAPSNYISQITKALDILNYCLLPLASSLKDIKKLLEDHEIDLVLLDVKTIDSKDLEDLIPILLNKDIPVLFLGKPTGFAHISAPNKNLFYQYITKPFSEFELIPVLVSVLTKHKEQKIIQGQKSLAALEEKSKEKFEQSPIGIFEVTRKGTLRTINQAMAKFLGFNSPEEALFHYIDIGKELYTDPSHRERFLQLIDSQGFVKDFEIEAKDKKGEKLWLLVSAKSMGFTDSGDESFHGFMQNITARKQIEEQTFRNNLCLQSLVTLLQRPIESVQSFLDVALDQALTITESSIGYIYLYNESFEEFTLNSWSKNVMDKCQIPNPKQRYVLHKTGLWGEVVRQRKAIVVNDYKSHPLAKGYPQGHAPLSRLLSIPIFVDDVIVAVIGVGNKETEYTDRDVLFLELFMDGAWQAITRHHLEQSYQQLFMSMSVGFILLEVITDLENNPIDYRWLRINPAAESSFGIRGDDYIGCTLLEVFPETEQTIWMDRLHRLVKTGEPEHFTSFTHTTSRYLKNTIYSPQPGQIAIIIHDITEITNKTNELEKSMHQVKKLADKCELASRVKSQFLANMSHEIRTPLNGIIGILQLLELTDLNAEQNDYVSLAIKSSNRLTRLLSDILDISRIEAQKMSIEPSKFEFLDLKEGVLDLFFIAAREKKITLRVHMRPDKSIKLIGDEMRLRQIIFNLVANALKFTSKGQIDIDLSVHSHEQSRLLICVSDTGPGIPDEKAGEVFDPFSQADGSFVREHQGAGLGLSIVSRLVQLMDGTLCFDSLINQGTTFCASIPIKISNTSDTFLAPGQKKNKNTKLHILLVEDDQINAQVATKILEKLGHRVSIASNGQQAVDQAQWTKFDIIFMDIQMPVMDGVQATKIIRASSDMASPPDIPIVAMTAHAMKTEKEHFLWAGMDAYLSKPTSIDEVWRVIKFFFNQK